jgi:nucleoside-diphosphate-sugar epimerase
MTDKRLFIFGFGYSAAALAQQLLAEGWKVAGTSRHEPKRREMRRLGIEAYDFVDPTIAEVLPEYNYLLSSIAPIKHGDTVLNHYGKVIAKNDWEWIGYLSSTGVYGDHGGEWVDESTPVKAGDNERLKQRIVAERKWLALASENQKPAHIFRLAGIYGPGRGVLAKLRSGMPYRIFKEGQMFSRCHVQDIALALKASMQQPQPGAIYNICDDEPEGAHIVTEYAAKQMGIAVPPLKDWQEADLPPMAKEFYSANRKVRNELIKKILPNQQWLYPTYREGIMADIEALEAPREAVY